MKLPSLYFFLLVAALVISSGPGRAEVVALPVVSIEATAPETTEPAPHIRVLPGEFTLRRSGALDTSLVVRLFYSGSATPGVDYNTLPERVEFAPGQESVSLQVLAIDDDEAEKDESVVATVQRSSNRTGPDYEVDPDRVSARVVIHDSDRPSASIPTVSIEATRRIAEETASPLRRLNLVGEFTVSRTGANELAQPVWIHVSGSATPREDYVPLPALITIPAGEPSFSFPVTALFDEIPEGIETVIATISNCPPAGSLAPCFHFEIDSARSSDTVFIREDGLSVATVHLTHPASGAHFATGEPIRLQAVAIHLESYLGRVEFCADGTSIGVSEIFFFRAPDPGTPITHEFVWQRAPSGPHLLTAKATLSSDDPNTRGQTITSSPVRITVGDRPPPHPNDPPSAAITSPASGDRFPAGNPIPITVESSDPDGFITRVEFFANGRKIGEHNIRSLLEPRPGHSQSFSFRWEHPMPGTYLLTARVTDHDGATADSPEVPITVFSEDSRPILSVVARDPLAIEPDSNRPVDTATFRILRNGSTTGDLTVRYTLHGRAENGVDYQRLPGHAVLPDGSAGIDVTIVPLADREAEGSESVTIQLEEDPSYAIGPPRRASAVIREGALPERPDPPRCIKLEDGLIHLCFPADPGRCFRIESSTNMRDWSTLFCLVAIDGTIHLVHEPSPELPRRWFRIAPEPNGLPDQ